MTEKIIDKLCANAPEELSKPRTYRRTARKHFLAASMKRNASKQELRRAIRKQLQYIARNLKHIGDLSQAVSLTVLQGRGYRNLLVVS
jgi:hypothetical protein